MRILSVVRKDEPGSSDVHVDAIMGGKKKRKKKLPQAVVPVIKVGDIPGHDFHGNQYTGGIGGEAWQRDDDAGPDGIPGSEKASIAFAESTFTNGHDPTPTERTRLRLYENMGFQRINGALRRGADLTSVMADPRVPMQPDEAQKYGLKTTVAQAVKSMDAIIARSSATQDVLVFRGIGGSVISGTLNGGTGAAAWKVGDVVSDKGYVSTDLRQSIAAGFGNVAEITVPKGTPAFSFRAAGATRRGFHENEVLLPRNSQFRVEAIDHPGQTPGFGPYRIRLTYLGPKS